MPSTSLPSDESEAVGFSVVFGAGTTAGVAVRTGAGLVPPVACAEVDVPFAFSVDATGAKGSSFPMQLHARWQFVVGVQRLWLSGFQPTLHESCEVIRKKRFHLLE